MINKQLFLFLFFLVEDLVKINLLKKKIELPFNNKIIKKIINHLREKYCFWNFFKLII